MDIKKLAELLGLSEDATEEQVVEALKVCLAENRSLKETEKHQPGCSSLSSADRVSATRQYPGTA